MVKIRIFATNNKKHNMMNSLAKSLLLVVMTLSTAFLTGCHKEQKEELKVGFSVILEVSDTGASCASAITSDGGRPIIERGVCWSKQSEPLVSGPHLAVEGEVGSFTCDLTGLDPNTTYYLRGYAINADGIVYGPEISFTTKELFDPLTISVLVEEGCLMDNSVIEAYEKYDFGFVMSSSKGLSSLVINIDNDEFNRLDLDSCSSYVYRDSLCFNWYKMAKEIIGDFTITATVTNVIGETSSVSMTIYVNYDAPLETWGFEWYKEVGYAGQGLEEFGLQWNANYNDSFARITPLDGARLYMFDSSVWSEVTTEVEKEALFATGPEIHEYANVSVEIPAEYDDVIGTFYQGTVRLIHVRFCYLYSGNNGYDVYIGGEWK